MKRITRASNVENLHDALLKLKGKRIQVVTTDGRQIRGIVSKVGRNFVIINGRPLSRNGSQTSQIGFFPFFFPFASLLFFSSIFFRRRRFFFF